jgi:hypothetical protein
MPIATTAVDVDGDAVTEDEAVPAVAVVAVASLVKLNHNILPPMFLTCGYL